MLISGCTYCYVETHATASSHLLHKKIEEREIKQLGYYGITVTFPPIKVPRTAASTLVETIARHRQNDSVTTQISFNLIHTKSRFLGFK